ncbi:antibiotic biosynthesis monooxygenase [Lacinutrix mariniflava]|uniref:antibiotic biosynthesis monooxygenase n=1 Tax=Lacinutrix mariniflava TaxID=342955 RepID=UPI0006E27D2C|nr:antibiotic biosynthesis monooxygenase [Lacinutrix mariniflava]
MKNILMAIFSVLIITSCSDKKETPTITQMVTFSVKPEYIQAFREAQVNSLNASLKEEGNLEMKLYANDNNPYELSVYSKWKNKEVYELHKTLPHSKALAPLFEKALASAPKVVRLEDTKYPHIDSKKLITTGDERAVFMPITIKEEYRDQVIKQFENYADNARKQEGNIFFDFYTVEGDANAFYVYENWKNGDDIWAAYVAQPFVTESKQLLDKARINIREDRDVVFASEYDETTLNENYTLEKLWEVEDVIMPESILSIPNHDFVYVSVINTYEKPGYISRYTKNGVLDAKKWVEGIAIPTGKAFYNGNMYVVDQSQVHIINIETAKIIKTIPSEAKTLNDITIGKDGVGYISDITTGRIFRLKDDKITFWLHSDEFPTPNGVLLKEGNLIVGSIGDELSQSLKPEQLGSLFKINLEDKSITTIKPSERMGAIDGVVPFKNGMIVSDPMNGKIFYVTNYKKEVITDNTSFGGSNADLGIDNQTQVLFVPYLFHNKIAAYKIVKK